MEPRTLSAGIVVVRRVGESWRYLLLRAYQYWDFPKGEVMPGEDPLAAAQRETEEEAGLTELLFNWGHIYRETPPYRQGKVARYYIAETRQGKIELPVSPVLHRPEHHEARWLTYDQARALLVPRVAAILDWAHEVIKPS